MKLLILFVSLVDSLLVVSWNVENFLDPKEDTTGRHTAKRLQNKCSSISKTLFLIADKFYLQKTRAISRTLLE